MRLTTDRITTTNALQKETGIPIGVIVKPYGDLSTVIFFIFNAVGINAILLGGRNTSN